MDPGIDIIALLDPSIWPSKTIPGRRQGGDDSDLELDFRDLEIVVVDQVEAFPVFLEGSEVFVNVVVLAGSSVP